MPAITKLIKIKKIFHKKYEILPKTTKFHEKWRNFKEKTTLKFGYSRLSKCTEKKNYVTKNHAILPTETKYYKNNKILREKRIHHA